MSLFRFKLFDSREAFAKWANDLTKTPVKEVAVGSTRFTSVKEFAIWAAALSDTEWAALHDEWVKVGPISPKQQLS